MTDQPDTPDLRAAIATVRAGDEQAAKWRVTITETRTFEIIVLAENEDDARRFAGYEWQDAPTTDQWATGDVYEEITDAAMVAAGEVKDA